MGSEVDDRERLRVARELGSAEAAVQHLRKINQEAEDHPRALSLAPKHRVVPKHALRYAKQNWDRVEAEHGKWSKPLSRARVDDLCDLTESLARANKVTRDTWQAFHPSWAQFLAATALAEAGREPRTEPFSRRTIYAEMGPEREKACVAYRALKKRPSRSSGQRKRSPSKEALATKAWEAANPALASILAAVVLTDERIPYLARRAGVTVEAYLKALRTSVDSLRLALATLNGSQQVPRKKGKTDEQFVGEDLSGSEFNMTTEKGLPH